MGDYYHGNYGSLSLLCLILLVVVERTKCATVVVDEVTEWKDPTANIGDTIIFKHKNEYHLYIFRTKEAYNSCNFTQASPLSKSTTYTWHPSRRGSFYFGFYNSSNIPCQQGQKLTIKISTTTISPSPQIQPPATTPGGEAASSPADPWPFQPREKGGAGGGGSPGPTYNDVGLAPMSPVTGMPPTPGNGMSSSIPFINSNPAVPLPTGEVDSATIQQPLPTPATAHHPSLSQGMKSGSFIEGVILSLGYVITGVVILV